MHDTTNDVDDGTDTECQIAGVGDTAVRFPWADDDRGDVKTDLFDFVVGTPDGANLPFIIRSVFGRDTDLAGADARLARRYFDDYPELFETTRRDGYVWVSPTPAAIHLNRRRHNAKNADGVGVAGQSSGTRCDYAKDRARAALSKWSTVGSDSTRAGLLRELATELDSIDDVWQVFERIRGGGPDHVCLPYTTRFNSTERAADLRATWGRAWRRARRRFDDAVVVTLTTDPGMHDDIRAATDALTENKNRLVQWLTYDPKSPDKPSRPGYRPPNLSVVEFTDSGLPHLHVVFFGLRWVTTQAALSRYWEDRGQGRVVDVRQLSKRGGEFVMSIDGLPDDPGGGGKRTARGYLGKSLWSLSELVDMPPGDVFDAAIDRRSGDPVDVPGDLWKLGLYWATGKRFFAGSPVLLRDDPDGDDGDALPFVPRYRFVGVARYEDLPGYIQNSATFVSQSKGPPPPSDRSASPGSPAPSD